MTVLDVKPPAQREVVRRESSQASGRHWPLARIFALGASLAALFALVVVVLGGVALWRLSDARVALIDSAGPALIAAQQLSNALLNQETGVRGYDLGRRAEFLDPYEDGRSSEAEMVSELRGLAATGRLPGLDANLDAVERAAQNWRTQYAGPVLAGTAVGVDPEQGRALFDQVRATLRTLLTDLQGKREAARTGIESASRFLLVVGVAIALLLASFLVAAAVGLRRGILRPVSELAVQVRQVASGDATKPVDAGGPREIIGLGADVEAMRQHILRDLDEAKEVNRRLDDQTRELERSNRDLEQFAYVASHDLQEPLRKVSSFCQLLQRRYGGQLDERADQYIAFAVDGASRMQRLINDLLSFSRVGRTTENFTAVDLGETAAVAAAQLEAAREETGGEIVLGELPVVAGDRALLQALLVNLLGNGLKFHREGVSPVVRVECRREDDSFEITVTDNGIGIEPEYSDKVFVIFQRLHGRDVYPGTGIGLALAKKIVEFHGGRIGLVETPGPGTTVRFSLPVPADTAAPEPLASEETDA
ncbi:sensor histidine kinase [Pseudonocardia xinjiangensis]|uniref:sensor histidine kinase n=1 Tax=Pseudonocardia xinjiangensis TaxID=75289 RepID=UPI003D8E2F23